MQLNLPAYPVKVRGGRTGEKEIWDAFRRKYVRLTPEEWVRQHFLHFLCQSKHYPVSLVAVEKSLTIQGRQRRFDAVVFKGGTPAVLMEFKAPEVKLTQAVFDQVALYNFALHADYLIISNGLSHYCCKMDYPNNRWYFLKDIPDFDHL
ncbi:type I restriction enzyme HsdR N-terminal domain-containing protein [Candidatus Sulfidibacterium hydrothermale]|uniref:type I restriction enzyme HsdR N-terminal domain-containing protein n=1 Tax=Candidatus Sulfidibacterium hydrothermale TaxID=2875962 RepID=UPI001F0A2481|nr:type I restriction enzyme HsdR N-terminal domain-containing protein [Candidatus Sulfidibacterium hydrothermale]UBM62913.1 type I restriction enzyme HsdR N-terminal domain-containing protein [Candidatus Sulfidibacterium hydrothermale]